MNSRKAKFAYVLAIVIAGFLANPASLDAQHVLPNDRTDLPRAWVGVAYTPLESATFRFFLSNGAFNNTWRAEAAGASTLPPGIIFNGDGTVTGTPTAAGNYSFRMYVTPAGMAEIASALTYTLNVSVGVPTNCHPARISMVIDRSGSMLETTASGQTKWEVLQRTVGIYIPVVTSYTTSNDRLDVMFFNNNAVSPTVSTPFDQGWMNNAGTVVTNVFGATAPTGGTPLGPGIVQAANGYAAGDLVRSMIVFTDGMQNQGHMVSNDGSGIPGAGINFAAAPYDQIRILTIGVGAGGGFRDMLRALAKPDHGYAQADEISNAEFAAQAEDAGTPSELRAMFYSTLPAILRYCSPRLLDYRRGIAKGKDFTEREPFTVNKFVKNLVIQVVPNGRRSLESLTLFKDGVKTPFEPTWDSVSYVYRIRFPQRTHADTLLTPEGDWELRFFGDEGVRYDIAAFVDDDLLKTDLGIGKPANTVSGDPVFSGLSYNNVNVGDDIRLQARVTYLGLPFDSAQVTAYLLRPGDDLGDLAAETFVDPATLKPVEAGTPQGQAKIDALMRDPAFAEKLAKVRQPRALLPVGNGLYAATFDGNTLTGTYWAMVRYRGTLPGGDKFEGWETKWVLVDFGEPADINLNAVRSARSGNEAGGTSYRLSITPTNRYGRKLGPGQANRIRVALQPGGDATLTDNLDGSYTINESFASGDEPNISVYVIDRNTPVYAGSVSALAGRNWFVSVHGGFSFPVDGFDTNVYKNGFFAEVDFGRMLTSSLFLEAVGGYYAFGSQQSIAGLQLFAGLRRPFGDYRLDLAVGGGYFKPENEDGEAGISGRLSLGRRLNSRAELSIDGMYSYLTNTKRSFATAGIGLKFYF